MTVQWQFTSIPVAQHFLFPPHGLLQLARTRTALQGFSSTYAWSQQISPGNMSADLAEAIVYERHAASSRRAALLRITLRD